jgi:hypothetical protein
MIHPVSVWAMHDEMLKISALLPSSSKRDLLRLADSLAARESAAKVTQAVKRSRPPVPQHSLVGAPHPALSGGSGRASVDWGGF